MNPVKPVKQETLLFEDLRTQKVAMGNTPHIAYGNLPLRFLPPKNGLIRFKLIQDPDPSGRKKPHIAGKSHDAAGETADSHGLEHRIKSFILRPDFRMECIHPMVDQSIR